MFRSIGTLKTYSSLAVFVTANRPLSVGGRTSAPGFCNFVGAARESVNKCLREWQRAAWPFQDWLKCGQISNKEDC